MATIQEAYQAACNAGFIKRNEFSEEAFGNMLQNDNNRRAYYDHVTKIDPTFYSKDYDTFSQNVLSALGKPNAKNSTNQPSNAPAPSQVQPTFQPAQGQPTFWQSIGAHDPYPQKTAEGVTQFEKEQQLQRESAATMPLSQQDKDRQAEIQRLQTEGIWGKPNGITMDIDKQTGLPTINQTKGDGMHLSIGATPSNQDEIDRLKAEQPAYITREIKTPQDLYASVSEAWAANTPDGQKAKAELDKTAQDTYNNLLADMNRQIADLQQQVNNGTVTQQQAQQEAQRIADNTNAVYENEMQLAQDYFFRQMTDANADYLSQQARLLGQKATNQTISDINARIAPHIRQLETERQQAMQRASQSVQAQGGMYGAIGASMSANTAYKPEKDQELALYHQSQQFLADAAKISDAAQKGEGFWKGLGKSLGDIDTWDFGISQLTRSANLKDIVEKYERGEQLTDAEKGLMDSAVAYMSACAYNSDKINRRYKMGQTTGESIPFMLQFMVMPIGAIKDKVAKGVLGYGIEQFGGKAAQAAGKVAAKYGAKTAFKEAGTALLSNLAAAGVQTAAFGVPKIAEGAISRMTGDIQPTITEQGNIAYNGRRNQQSAASAVWNSAVDMYAENLSEMILTSLDPLKAYAGTAKLFSGLKNSQIAQVLGRLNEGVIGKVRDRVQFRNYLEEVGEEYVGNLIRWGLSTDVNNAEDAGLSADRQIDTWLGLAPTSIAFGAANIVEGGIDRFQSSRAAKRLREIMADGDKRRYLESLLKSRNSDDFSKNAHEVIKSVLRDKELNEDTKRLIMDGIYSTYQSQLAQEAEQARIQAETERQAQPEQPETPNVSDSAQPQTQAQVQVNTEGEEHYQDADGNEVTFYRNADGSVSLRDENDNAAVDEHGNAVVLTQAEFDKYTQDTNLRRVDRELSADQWAERENELRQQYATEIRPNTHNDGNVYEVALASDGNKHGYIVGDGKVEIDDTTDPAVPRITNADVVTVRYEDGTMAQVAAKDLNLVEVDSAEQIVEDNLQPFQQYAQAMQTFRTGQEVTMDNGNGNTYTSRVVSVSEDGVEVEIEDQLGNPTTWTFDNATALTALQPVEQAQPAVDIANPKPIGTNKFGTIYQWVVGKAKEAAQFLFHNRNSYLKGVFHRDDIGDIDLVWGNDKAGFQHIIKRHILEQTDFGSINDAIEAISKTIQNGRIVSENDSQCTIDDGTYRVAIAKDGTGNWVVTAYDNSRGKVEKQRGNTNSPLVVPSTEQNNPSDVAFSHQENGDTSMSNLFSGKDTTNNSDTQVPAPNIDTMSPEELGASAVEFMGGVADGKAYLEAERDKADAEVKRLAKQKINKYTDAADFKRQNDELKKARTEAASRFNKLEQALITANNYKTQKEKAEKAALRALEEEIRAIRRQTQTAQLANAAPAERWKAAPKVEGNAVTRTLSDGTVIKGHYVLVEAGAATPSHDPFNGWNTSNGFPVTEDGKNINDRDYKNDTDAQQITTQIAQTYDGQAVAQVPVVSSEGIVYDGNGRTIAGNIAAANNTDGAYIKALADNAGNFGFTAEQVAGMQHPRVYMQTDEDLPYNTTTFAKFNAQEKKSQGSTNRAVSSSKKLTEAARDGMLRILDDYGTLDAFFASENGAKDIVRSLLDNGIITQQEVAGLTESTDKGFVLSPAGKDYVTDLLIGGLFDEQTIRMLGNDKGLKQSILRAMPSIVENRRLGDYALTDNINNAIRLLYEARQAGMAYPLYVKQGNAFDGYVSDRFSPFEMLLAEEMSSGVETFRQVLNLYNNSARDDANGQTGLFEPRTFDDIKNEILQHYGKSTDQSAATAAESTQSRHANTQTEPPVPSTPTGDGQERDATDIPASNILEQIEAEAEPFEEIELTPANWYALFGEDGIVSTPIGYVKMGEHQYLKLAQKGRDGKLGMIKPTLEHPSVVVMDKSQAKDGQNTEREFSYVFVKAFVGKNGERLYYFTSITVSKDGQEVVISNQEKERSRIQRLLKNGKLAYINKATLPPASDKTIQGDQLTNPVGEELSSADKGTKNIPNSQTPEQKSAENLPNASRDEQSHTEEAPKDEQSKDNGGKEQSQSQQSNTPKTFAQERTDVDLRTLRGAIQIQEIEDLPKDIAPNSLIEVAADDDFGTIVRIGFKNKDLYVQTESKDADGKQWRHTFIVPNARQHAIANIADKFYGNQVSDFTDEEREALKDALYKADTIEHLNGMRQGNIAYQKASAHITDETTDTEIHAITELTEAPERQFAQWVDTLNAGNIRRVAKALNENTSLEAMRALGIAKRAFSRKAREELGDIAKSYVGSTYKLSDVKRVAIAYAADNIYHSDNVPNKETIEAYVEKIYNEAKAARIAELEADLGKPLSLDDKKALIKQISDGKTKVVLVTNKTIVKKLAKLGATRKTIADVAAAVSRGDKVKGFFAKGMVILNTDVLQTGNDIIATYVHERQHLLTAANPQALSAITDNATADELAQILQTITGTAFYDQYNNGTANGHTALADELVSHIMQEAYATGKDAAEVAKGYGITNETILQTLNNIDYEQQQSNSLSKARRDNILGRNTQSSSRQSGGNNQTQSQGGLVQHGTRPAGKGSSGTPSRGQTAERGEIADTPVSALSFDEQAKSLKELISFHSKEEEEYFDSILPNLKADKLGVNAIPLEVILQENSIIEKLEGRASDYIAEHYPTQGSVSALTNSPQGKKEREAMWKDPALAQLRKEVNAQQDAAQRKIDGKYEEVKAITDKPSVTLGEVAQLWNDALEFSRNLAVENDIRFSIGKASNNLHKSLKSSTFAGKKSQVPKAELAVAYADMFRKQAQGQFSDGNGFAYSANYLHSFERGRIVLSIPIEGNEDYITDYQKRHGTNSSTGTFSQGVGYLWRSQRPSTGDNGIPQRQRNGDERVDRLYGAERTDGTPDNQEIDRDTQPGSQTELTDPRFSVSGTQVVPLGERTLVGLHNISSDKLRKVLKAGGLANPSAAVIDIAKQDHHGYGEISLVMPSSLVDSREGNNAGTYTGDMWSPTYPLVERRMTNKGADVYYKALNSAFGNDHARRGLMNKIALGFSNWLNNQHDPKDFAYWYMLENDITPQDVLYNSGIPASVKQRFEPIAGKRLYEYSEEDRALLLSLIAEQRGITTEELKQEAQELRQRYQETLDDPNSKVFQRRIAQDAIEDIDTYGVKYNVLEKGIDDLQNAIKYDGKIDIDATLSKAKEQVQANYKDDFEKWLNDFDERFDIKEYIFDGYTRNGDRKYIPNTLTNASRLMNREELQNAGSHGGFNATKGQLIERMNTLADIRANKYRLTSKEGEKDEQWEQLSNEWFTDIIDPLSKMQKISDNPFSNIDYAEQRLLAALWQKDPIAHLNKEYGYKITKESTFAKALNDLVQRIKDMPAKYFETKFKRPVSLDEFRNAVVPNDLSQDLRDGLEKAGLGLYEYDPETEGSRREATLQATEDDGIRFSIIGERGAANLDHAEEVTTRIDNLQVARDMEKNGKDAKTIRLATGWERGADKKWRYEIPDFKFKKDVELDGVPNVITLSNLVDAPELFAAYPELRDMNVRYINGLGGHLGQYTSEFRERKGVIELEYDNNTAFKRTWRNKEELKQYLDKYPNLKEYFNLNQELDEMEFQGDKDGFHKCLKKLEKADKELKGTPGLMKLKRLLRENRSVVHAPANLSVLIHEVQHAIQDIENFAGTSSLPKDLREWFPNKIKNNKQAYRVYMSLVNEVEARNAQSRMRLSEQQRREHLLAETEDVARKDQLFMSVITEDIYKVTGNIPEAQYDELDYDIDNLTDAQQFDTDVLLGALDEAGISVERVSEEDAEREVVAQKKSLDDTATWSELMVRANKAADITSNDNAKVLQKIETAKQKIANQSGKNIKNIAGVIADAAELSQRGSSHYGTFKATNGDVFTIRVSNHNATVSNFDNENEADGVSIVISNKPNTGISNDGSAHIVEYFYRKADLLKSYGNPIADILGAIKTLIESGEYTDPTGLAQRQEVNIPAEFNSPEFSIVYHGSGNKFSHFDHSHMGEGEGQQAYGWGTYVTKVKSIGKDYAVASAKKNDKTFLGFINKQGKRYLYTVEIPDTDYYNAYIPFEQQVGKDIATTINNALQKQFGISRTPIQSTDTGQKVYQYLVKGFAAGKSSNAPRSASLFLSKLGFIGLSYPANYQTGGRSDGARNYVIFNEDNLQIKNRAEFLRTSNGTICGYAKDGKIYLTDKGFNPNTPIHEYTHLWVKAVRNNNAELYDNLRDLFSRKNLPDMWNELDNDPQYRDLSDEAKLSEIIARFSGKRGAERMEQEAQKLIDDAKQEGKRAVADAVSFRERMRNLLRRFWNWVGEHLFHIKHFGSREEAADRVLYDILNATDLHQLPAEKDSQAEFSTSPMPKRMDGEMVHEWAKRIAEWKRQQIDEQQVAEYAKLLDKNNSKKSKVFAYVVDKFTPIDNFQQWVQAQGGVYNPDTMDMHSDISLALGRIETFSRRYKNDYMQRIADSIAQIAKDNHIADPLLALGLKWQNFDNKKMNGKPLTVREIMGVYAQAKDTWEADQQGLSDRGAQGFVKNLGVSHTDIIEAVERIIPQKQLDEFWNAVYAANQFALDYQLNAGMIDPDTRNRYTRRYYVPQRDWRERDFDGKDTAYIKDNGTRLYGNPYNAALVKAHGRESLASDPFALIESIGLTSITQSEHNKSKQQLLNLLLANEMLGLKSGAWRVKQVWSKNVIDPRTGHVMRKPDGTPVQAEVTYAAPTQQEREHDASINAQIEQLSKELKDLTQPAARAKRETEIANLQDQLIYTGRATDTMLEHRTRDERLQHQIIVLHDGQQYVIELQDERLANAVNGNFGEAIKAYALFNKYNAPAIRYISGVLTQYNPRFAHRNFWRDAQAAFLNNLSEQGVAFTTRAMANIPMVQRTVWKYILADTYKGKEKYTGQFGDYLREYFEAGAQTGFSFMPELERMAKDFNKMVKGENAWDKVWGKGVKGTLSLMTEASELTVRFAEYVTARQMGRSVQEAAKLAKNISVNFNQSGLMSKEMSKFFTFFNATIQGNMRFLMPYGKNKPKFGEKAFKFGAKFAGMAANFALLGLLSTFLQPDNPDDDTWFTEYDRMSNFILFGKVKIPVVHFFRMFYAAGVQAALAAQGRKTWKDAFYTSADYALGELVPASALQIQNLWDYDETTNTLELNPAKYAQAAAPSVISPLVDVAVNRDFKGSTVYRKKWDNDKKDITTAKRNTPQWAIDVSNTLHRWSGGNPDVPYKGGNTDGWIDIKPNAIEHLAQGYFSGVWEGLGHTTGFIWDGAHDPDVYKHAANWPFLRDLFRDYNEEKAYNQQYYSVLKKLEKYEKRVNTLSKNEFNAEKQTNRFQTFKQVSKQLRRLPNPYNDEETTVTSEDVNKILQLDIELNRNLFTD